MANISFLDLMLAEALASGLAREARRAERPPPDNYFLLPPDPDAWRKIRDASKKESMVVCIEFTDNSSENCRRVQGVFMDLAREFEGIPFVRAVISPGCIYTAMREDLGGVQYTPTILMVFYAEDSIQRAKFEGMKEIADGLNSGRIKGVIKELIERRVKLKMAERATERLQHHIISQLSDRERKIREEYETKLERQLKEREEELKKKEDERARKEKEEEQEKDAKQRLLREQLRKQREEHKEELFKMDLDSSSVRELKVIMEKMGISSRGCLSKADLKEKLFDQVPELRIRSSGYSPKSKSRNSSMSSDDGGGGDNTIDMAESARLTKDLEKARDSLSKKESEITSLQRQLQVLQKTLREERGGASKSDGNESAKVKKLELSLLETRMLYTTNLQDFEILDLLNDSKGEKESDNLVLRARCTKPGLPHPDRTYAMKVLTNYFVSQTQTQVRQDYENEYQVLCRLPPHENIIHMWAFFYDRPATPEVLKFFKKAGNDARGMSLFILMEEHPSSMAEQLRILVNNKGPRANKVVEWLKDLLNGLAFLEKNYVVHRDLKLSNLLLAASGRVVISDFGKALDMDGCFTTKHTNGFDIGGNHAHLAPEVLNSRPPRNMLDYSKQPVWAAGVLAYELAGHPSPFASGVLDQRGYTANQLPPLENTHCRNNSFSERLPTELSRLVHSMLKFDRIDRPSLQHCLDTINNV